MVAGLTNPCQCRAFSPLVPEKNATSRIGWPRATSVLGRAHPDRRLDLAHQTLDHISRTSSCPELEQMLVHDDVLALRQAPSERAISMQATTCALRKAGGSEIRSLEALGIGRGSTSEASSRCNTGLDCSQKSKALSLVAPPTWTLLHQPPPRPVDGRFGFHAAGNACCTGDRRTWC